MGNGFIKLIKDSVLSVIYSEAEGCVLCGEESIGQESVCKNCLKKIEFYNRSFNIKQQGYELECYCSTYYSGAVVELVRRLKYKGDFLCGRVMGDLLIKLLEIKNIEYDFITYVPMTRKALRKRGFNQGKFLAGCLGDEFDRPVKKLIKKIKNTRDQIGLDAEGRWRNLEGCFRIREKTLIQNKKILLIDDVVTTGATAFWCSMELLKNGADNVTILTVAKSKV